MVERERKESAGLQQTGSCSPTLCEYALVKAIRIVRLLSRVRNRLQSLRSIFRCEELWITTLECQTKPSVEEVGELGVEEQATERRVRDDQIDGAGIQSRQGGSRSA